MVPQGQKVGNSNANSPGGPAGAVTGAFRRCPTRDICSFSLAAARARLCRSPRGLPGAASWHTAPGSWFCSDRAVTKPASWIIHQRPCPAAASALPEPAGSCCATETPGVAGGHQGTLTAVLRAPGPSCITPPGLVRFQDTKGAALGVPGRFVGDTSSPGRVSRGCHITQRAFPSGISCFLFHAVPD